MEVRRLVFENELYIASPPKEGGQSLVFKTEIDSRRPIPYKRPLRGQKSGGGDLRQTPFGSRPGKRVRRGTPPLNFFIAYNDGGVAPGFTAPPPFPAKPGGYPGYCPVRPGRTLGTGGNKAPLP